MGTQREIIYKELLIRYRKEKIRQHLYKGQENLNIEEKQKIELKVDSLWKDNLKNPELLKEICGFVIVEDTAENNFQKALTVLRSNFDVTECQDEINPEEMGEC